MRRLAAVTALGLMMTAAAAEPALACALARGFDPTDVQGADAVVTGRVSGYRMVRDQEARRLWRERAARNPGLGGILGREPPDSLLSDEVSFDLAVEQVLVGQVPRRMRVKWDPSTFTQPDHIEPGRYLVALRRGAEDQPPSFRVFRRPCSTAFLLRAGEPEALAVLRVLAGKPPFPPDPPEPPEPEPTAADDIPRPAPALPAPRAEAYQDSQSLLERIPPVYRVMLGGAALGVLVAVSALLWRRRVDEEAEETKGE